MKIKCPLCKQQCINPEFHVLAYHDLIEKIYEKIDLLNERKKIEEGEDIPFPNCTETVKQILKSLLEDENAYNT